MDSNSDKPSSSSQLPSNKLKDNDASDDDKCPECHNKFTFVNIYGKWCQPCSSLHFKDEFCNWTSGNEEIDKFLREVQLNAGRSREVLQWVPYNRLEDVKEIAKGGFGIVYSAKWPDGPIRYWNVQEKRWERRSDKHVALKTLDSSMTQFLNEVKYHLKMNSEINHTIPIYGITQNPNTQDYWIVMSYAEKGNLRNFLRDNFYNITWEQKVEDLWRISVALADLHHVNLVHHDLHPGNILLTYDHFHLSDFGLSKLIERNQIINPNGNICGVLPYIAPEVLIGEEYTATADVYSFGIIAYEVFTGNLAYHDISHNYDLALQICNGLRPKIPFHTPRLITRMIMQCWDARPSYRPLYDDLRKLLKQWHNDLVEDKIESEIRIQIEKAKEFTKNQSSNEIFSQLDYKIHPGAVYTSRLLNYTNLPEPSNAPNYNTILENLSVPTSNNWDQYRIS